MENHKDLPPRAQQWARGVDKDRDTIKHLEEVVKRLTSSMGLDYRNPQRGINPGDTPSVQNPLTLKLNSLNDMAVRNAQDGDFVMWSAVLNKWVPGQAYRPTDEPIITNLFPYPNPELATWGAPDSNDGLTFAAMTPVTTVLSGGKIVQTVPYDEGGIAYYGFVFPMNNAGIEIGKTYVFSFDIEIDTSGETPGTPPAGTVPDIKFYGQVASRTIFEYSTVNGVRPFQGSARISVAFRPEDATDLDGSKYFANSMYVDPNADGGTIIKYSNFMVAEATTNLSVAFIELTAGQSFDLIAAGAVPGQIYQIDGQPWDTASDAGNEDYWLKVQADGVSIAALTFGGLKRMTSFLIPPGTTSCTVSTVSGWWDNIHIYQPVSTPYFNGDTPANASYTYSWAGVPWQSASIRTPTPK